MLPPPPESPAGAGTRWDARQQRAPSSTRRTQMMGLPTWFKALVYSELALQLPFFFVAAHAFLGANECCCCGGGGCYC